MFAQFHGSFPSSGNIDRLEHHRDASKYIAACHSFGFVCVCVCVFVRIENYNSGEKPEKPVSFGIFTYEGIRTTCQKSFRKCWHRLSRTILKRKVLGHFSLRSPVAELSTESELSNPQRW